MDRSCSSRVGLVACALGIAGAALADPLNPLAFPSLGNVTLAPGAHTIDTAATPPTITGPDGSVLSGSVHGFGGSGIAVFSFDGLVIPPSVTFTISGYRPLALLSTGDMTIGAAINVSGAPGHATPRRSPGPGGLAVAGYGNGGNGGGYGRVQVGVPSAPSLAGNGNGPGGAIGPAFGFGMGDQFFGENRPGRPYGNLLRALEGGSGGSGAMLLAETFSFNPNDPAFGACGGGAGGGALELGALGTLTLTGNLVADGGRGRADDSSMNAHPGGGGSGGGILVHASSVNLAGTVSARGGACWYSENNATSSFNWQGHGGAFGGSGGMGARNSPGASGGGGGGRVAIQSVNTPSLTGVDVSGGAPFVGGLGNPGEAGVITSARVALVATTLDFGEVAVGTSKTMFMGITSGGDPDTCINGRFPVPPPGSPFSRLGEGVFSGLKPGKFHVNPYAFAPAMPGVVSHTLTFLSNAGPVEVTITGRGVMDCMLDLNGDGEVDPDDLADYIAAYFGGC